MPSHKAIFSIKIMLKLSPFSNHFYLTFIQKTSFQKDSSNHRQIKSDFFPETFPDGDQKSYSNSLSTSTCSPFMSLLSPFLAGLCGLNNQFTCVLVCHISISSTVQRTAQGIQINIHPFGVIYFNFLPLSVSYSSWWNRLWVWSKPGDCEIFSTGEREGKINRKK